MTNNDLFFAHGTMVMYRDLKSGDVAIYRFFDTGDAAEHLELSLVISVVHAGPLMGRSHVVFIVELLFSGGIRKRS